MAKFLNIGDKVINLDQVTTMIDGLDYDDNAELKVRFSGETSIVVFRGDDRERLLTWMNGQDRLHNLEERRISSIVRSAFDPFIDTDRLTTIYSLFNEIPGHEHLLLCLESEEVGSVRTKEMVSEVLVSWNSGIRAVDRLRAYRDSMQEEQAEEFSGNEEAHEWASDHQE